MSFQVTIRSWPDDKMLLSRAELSSDSLQLRLVQDADSIVNINGVMLSRTQKITLRTIGSRYQVTDLTADRSAVVVVARREGHVRKWRIDEDGNWRFVDGHESIVSVPRADPLRGRLLTGMVN